MNVPLPDAAKALLARPVFATVAAVEPNTQPHLSVIWVKTDGEDVVFSTVEGRRKHRNMLRNPRVSVLAFDPGDPYSYIEVRGTASMTTEGGPELIQELSHKYRNHSYTGDLGTDHVRVLVRVTPEKVFVRRPKPERDI